MAALSFGIATTSVSAAVASSARTNWSRCTGTPSILCIGWVTTSSLSCINAFVLCCVVLQVPTLVVVRRKDPEGILGPPQTGHLARLEFRRRLERDAEAREAFDRQAREEKERRQALRQVITNSTFPLLLLLVSSYDLYIHSFSSCALLFT